MRRYRLARFPGMHSTGFAFDCELAHAAYVDVADELRFEGWLLPAAPTTGNLESLRLMVTGTRRRQVASTSQFNFSVASAEGLRNEADPERVGFSLDVINLPEALEGKDFAVEVQARVGGRWLHLQTLTFVVDEWRQDAVFVVGSPRSGTTIIGDSIRKTLGAGAGFGESHLLPLCGAVKQTVRDFHKGNAAAKNPNMLLHHINSHLLGEQMLSVLKQQYANLLDDQCVIDKTPGGAMLWALPDIQRLWPDARVIFAKRRGIENIVSRLKKFPDIDFEAHCHQWRNCMNAWQQVRGQLNHTLEIDQFDVLTQPRVCATRLADFLALTEEQTHQLSLYFQNDRPEHTGKDRAPQVFDLEKLEWTAGQKALFRATCQSDLERWGYSLDGSYYLEAHA